MNADKTMTLIRRILTVADIVAGARETQMLAGLVLIAAGIWMVYPPAALVTVGAVVFVLGFLRRGDGRNG